LLSFLLAPPSNDTTTTFKLLARESGNGCASLLQDYGTDRLCQQIAPMLL
jgi:hypothetical protein